MLKIVIHICIHGRAQQQQQPSAATKATGTATTATTRANNKRTHNSSTTDTNQRIASSGPIPIHKQNQHTTPKTIAKNRLSNALVGDASSTEAEPGLVELPWLPWKCACELGCVTAFYGKCNCSLCFSAGLLVILGIFAVLYSMCCWLISV